MNRLERIRSVLEKALAPLVLEVVDESHLHAGHAGARPEGETHYRVRIVAESFNGQSRVARHRTVNDLLAPELASGLHALAIQAEGTKDRIT